MEFYHVDVFSQNILSGNGLTVVFNEEKIKEVNLLKLAQELKQFETIYLNIEHLEGRTWDNKGIVEDVATGSAAGPVAAFLYKHKVCSNEKSIIINQGRYVGRPSKIKVSQNLSGELLVSGDVAILAKGFIVGKIF